MSAKTLAGFARCRDVSLTVTQNRIVGIIGPNGAGKTTLFNVITGAYRANAGEIVFDGNPITHWQPYRIVRAGISRTFQNIRLFVGMTVLEHLIVAQPHAGSAVRSILPMRWADPAALARAEALLTFFGLQDYRETLACKLPYGLQRKVEIARALTTQPQLLLLDEPVAGMNHDESRGLARSAAASQQRWTEYPADRARYGLRDEALPRALRARFWRSDR